VLLPVLLLTASLVAPSTTSLNSRLAPSTTNSSSKPAAVVVDEVDEVVVEEGADGAAEVDLLEVLLLEAAVVKLPPSATSLKISSSSFVLPAVAEEEDVLGVEFLHPSETLPEALLALP